MVNFILSFTYSFIIALAFSAGVRVFAYVNNVNFEEFILGMVTFISVAIWIMAGLFMMEEAKEGKIDLAKFWRK